MPKNLISQIICDRDFQALLSIDDFRAVLDAESTHSATLANGNFEFVIGDDEVWELNVSCGPGIEAIPTGLVILAAYRDEPEMLRWVIENSPFPVDLSSRENWTVTGTYSENCGGYGELIPWSFEDATEKITLYVETLAQAGQKHAATKTHKL